MQIKTTMQSVSLFTHHNGQNSGNRKCWWQCDTNKTLLINWPESVNRSKQSRKFGSYLPKLNIYIIYDPAKCLPRDAVCIHKRTICNSQNCELPNCHCTRWISCCGVFTQQKTTWQQEYIIYNYMQQCG